MLTSQMQEMQEQTNSTNDSGEFQEVESNHSGRLSYVSSPLAMIPSSRSMLSRDKRLPLDTWNTSGLQENAFGNQFSAFESSSRNSPFYDTRRDRISSTGHRVGDSFRKRDDKQNQGTIPNADICEKAVDHEFINTGGNSAEFYGWTAKTANFGTTIRQIP